MKKAFFEICDFLETKLAPKERFSAYFNGEDSSFVRFNGGHIRQPGSVLQKTLDFRLIVGSKQAVQSISLTGDKAEDEKMLEKCLFSLRERLSAVADDPFLLTPAAKEDTSQELLGQIPAAQDVVSSIFDCSRDLDLVGIYAQGKILSGFCDSNGQKNWFESDNFHFDWSLYAGEGKAVKQSYAGRVFEEDTLRQKIEEGKKELSLLTKPRKSLRPGKYRVYLAPSAMEEIMGMLSWGGFSRRNLETKQSPLLRLKKEQEKLHESVFLSENLETGYSPRFNHEGFIKPDRVPLIEKGLLTGALTSPRTEKEFSLDGHNGANESESFVSLTMAGGDIARDDVLKTLGTGLYINNLWYLNYSDRAHCRLTGMTRFATFWVENGEIVACVDVMRFDETFYRMFGSGLVGLTKEREVMLSSETYGERSTKSATLPGAVVDGFTLTL